MAVAGIHNPVPWQVHLSGRLRDIWYLIRQSGRKVQQVQDGAGAFTTKQSNSPSDYRASVPERRNENHLNAYAVEKKIQESPKCNDGLKTDFNDHSSNFEDSVEMKMRLYCKSKSL